MDQNWNSAYPYAIGPTFYGNYSNRLVTSIPGGTTIYSPSSGLTENSAEIEFTAFPNPGSEFVIIQITGLNKEELHFQLIDQQRKVVSETTLLPSQTFVHLDTQTLYAGMYTLHCVSSQGVLTKSVAISH